MLTASDLRRDLERLGVAAGDTIMVHAAMSRVGKLIGGPDTLIDALLDAIASTGTLVAYTDWNADYDDLIDADGKVPAGLRAHLPPFDPLASRAIRNHGVLAEFIRTRPGAWRSGNPGASVAALGAGAAEITANHPLDYGYGEDSPFGKLVAAGGKVLMVGAPYDTMSLLHHAEQLAQIPGKKVRRIEVPFATPEGTAWRMIEEFETGEPVVAGLAEDYFETLVTEFLATGCGRQGSVGAARSILVEAREIAPFAVAWIERNAPR